MPGSGRVAASNLKHGDEEHYTNAVVEERLPCQLSLYPGWNSDTAQHFKHCDRVYRRNEGAKDKTLDPRDVPAAEEVHEERDKQKGDRRTREGKQRDNKSFPGKLLEIQQKG